MRTGTITLIEGVSKKSNKPYKALQLKAGKWQKMYFVESQFEMDYIFWGYSDCINFAESVQVFWLVACEIKHVFLEKGFCRVDSVQHPDNFYYV